METFSNTCIVIMAGNVPTPDCNEENYPLIDENDSNIRHKVLPDGGKSAWGVFEVNSDGSLKRKQHFFLSTQSASSENSFVDLINGKIYLHTNEGYTIYDPIDNSVEVNSKEGYVSSSSGVIFKDINLNDVITKKSDGSIHIGENSLVTIEENGVQKLYAEDENGDAIDIDITNGSDLLINGVSVIDRLNADNRTYIDSIANNLADGIEDSNAMSAALAALPNTAPDAEAYCGGGIGSYGDAQAFSLGCASNINENFAVNFGASKLSSSGASIGNREFDDYSLKAGFIYKIGYKSAKSGKSNTAKLETELYKQQANLRAIAEKENYKDTKIAEYEKRLAKLEDQLEEFKVALLAGNRGFASLVK